MVSLTDRATFIPLTVSVKNLAAVRGWKPAKAGKNPPGSNRADRLVLVADRCRFSFTAQRPRKNGELFCLLPAAQAGARFFLGSALLAQFVRFPLFPALAGGRPSILWLAAARGVLGLCARDSRDQVGLQSSTSQPVPAHLRVTVKSSGQGGGAKEGDPSRIDFRIIVPSGLGPGIY